MRRTIAVLALLAVGACSRPQPLNPYVPPEVMYSAGGTIAAAGGTAAMAAGASMMDRKSPTTQKAGMAAAAGGAALMGVAIAEALDVKKERQKFVNLYNAFIRNYYGSPDPDMELRTPPPPLPDVPVEIPADDSPLSGKDPKP